MNTATETPIMLYTEQTPNPETLKFVTNKMLYSGTADFKEMDLAKEWSPLAEGLYGHPYVKSVYISNNYVTVTKEFNYEWSDIMLQLKQYIKDHVQDGKTIVKDGFQEAVASKQEEELKTAYTGDDAELVVKIKNLIDTYVKPAVESDGGNIEFKSYDKGVVTVIMQGACSGCPSSTVTLKSGIEGMLKRMIPEVKEVVQEMG